jgi:thymidine kinase
MPIQKHTQIISALHLFMGCMFAGKSTELLRQHKINQQRFRNKNDILIINHAADTRYAEEGKSVVSTHNKEQLVSQSVSCLKTLQESEEYIQSKVILIDEAQFFTGLYDFVVTAVEHDNKIVYVFGLDADSDRKSFGELLQLIPMATTYQKLFAKCDCGADAIHTKRIVESNEQMLVGSQDSYIPVCRRCYNK